MIRIAMREEGGVPKVVSFEKEQVTIGRAPDNDLCLTGRGISGRHCRFFQTPGGIVLEDLGSTNGTYLNRKRLQHPVRVSGQDEIVLAMYELRLLDSAASVDPSAVPQSNEARPSVAAEGAAVAPPPDARRVLTAAVVAPPLTGPWHAASAPPLGKVPVAPPPPTSVGAEGRALTGQGSAVAPPGSPVSSRGSSGDSIAPPSGSDADWAREWKKIDMLARAWIDAGRDRGLLLRGEKLTHARRWLNAKAGKSPAPRREHQDFIHASVRAGHLRLTRNIGLGSAALVVVAVSASKVSPILFPPPVIEEPKQGGPTPDTKTETEVRTTSTPEDLHREALEAAAAAAELLEDDPSMATLVAMNALDHISARERGSQPEQVLRAGLSKLEGVPLLGHDKAVTAVGFSPNGRWAYSASDDFTARVWDLESRGLISPYVLRGHIAELRGVAVTPDSHYVFTAAVDGSILRWDLTHAQPNTTAEPLRGHEYTVTALALSGDGRWLASGANDGVLRVWDAAHPAEPPKKANGHDAPIRSLSFSRDGSMLASAGEDALGNLWRVDETGTPARRARLEGHEGPVHAVALSPDKRWVLTGSDDRTARLWDPAKKIPALTHRILSGHEGSVRRVAITPDGTLAVTAGDDSQLMVWNLESKEPELGAVKFDLHRGGITDLAVMGAQESGGDLPRTAASGSLDQTARTWNLERREHEQSSTEFRGLGDVVSSVGFSGDGLRLIVGARNGNLRIWDHQTQGSGGASRAAVGHPSGILDVAVNVVGTRMVTAGADSTARIWDLTSPGWVKQLAILPEHKGRVRTTAIDQGGRFVATAGDDGVVRLWALDKEDPAASHLPLRGHKSVVNEVAFLPDDSALVSISADKTARYWPLTQTAEKDSVVLPHRDEVNSMALSRDGRWLVTGTLSQVYRWDLKAQDIAASGRPLDGKGRARLHEVDILAVGVGPDGRWAASSSQDPALVLWDLANHSASIRLRRHSEPVDTIAFSPDGRWLATGSRDMTIRLWDLKAEHPDETSLLLSGHEGRVGSLRFSNDSSRLMSGGYDKTVRIWDLGSQDEIQISKTVMVLRGHDQLISAIDMSGDMNGDERLIVSASYDGTARVWPLDAEELIAIGCRRVGRNLTPEEWTRYFSDNYKTLCTY